MNRLVPCAALALAAGLSGCKTTGGGVQRSVADVVLPVEDEKKLGAEMEAQLARELTLLDDPEVVGYVRELGRQIVAAAGDDVPEGIEFEFDVVDDDETINAFAIPGGHIYVYTGLLRAAEDEAELMGVIGHEVAHVTRRHIAQQLAAQYGAETLLSLVASSGGLAGLVGQLVGSVGAQGFLLKYSRDAERDADYVGLEYAADAGWDPHGMIDFFTKLERQAGRGSLPSFLLTHPEPGERVENARERIDELDQVPWRRNRERYQQVVSRLGGPAPSGPAK